MDEALLIIAGLVCGWLGAIVLLLAFSAFVCILRVPSKINPTATAIGLVLGALTQFVIFACVVVGLVFALKYSVSKHAYYHERLYFYIPAALAFVPGYLLNIGKLARYSELSSRRQWPS